MAEAVDIIHAAVRFDVWLSIRTTPLSEPHTSRLLQSLAAKGKANPAIHQWRGRPLPSLFVQGHWPEPRAENRKQRLDAQSALW